MTLYKNLKHKYNKSTNNTLRIFSKQTQEASTLKTSTTFLIKCRETGIIPNFLKNSTKNVDNIFKTNNKIQPNIFKLVEKHTYNYHIKLLKLLIQYKHKLIKENNEQVIQLRESIENMLEEKDKEIFFKVNEFWENTPQI